MKKILFLLAFLPSVAIADFYDVQFFKVNPDTTTITVDWSYRGDIYVVSGDTTTASLIEDCTAYILLYATGSIRCIDLHVGDGGSVDYADGDGDGYFKDEIEADGRIYSNSKIESRGSGVQVYNDVNLKFGDGSNVQIKYDSTISSTTVKNASGDLLLSFNNNSTILKSTTSAGLQGTTPGAIGEAYMHATSPGICISTGILIGQYGYIPVQSLP